MTTWQMTDELRTARQLFVSDRRKRAALRWLTRSARRHVVARFKRIQEVRVARRLGASWADVGASLGMTAREAEHRFARATVAKRRAAAPKW